MILLKTLHTQFKVVQSVKAFSFYLKSCKRDFGKCLTKKICGVLGEVITLLSR